MGAIDDGLSAVDFGPVHDRLGSRVDVSRDPVLSAAAHQLAEYFEGVRTRFDLPLQLEGTEFQVAAWRALDLAHYGTTMSYAQQAHAIGRPRAVRAVGAANSRNPVAIVLPCHRVVGSNGSLTGYAGGLDVKRWLLDHEASVVAGRGPLEGTRTGREGKLVAG